MIHIHQRLRFKNIQIVLIHIHQLLRFKNIQIVLIHIHQLLRFKNIQIVLIHIHQLLRFKNIQILMIHIHQLLVFKNITMHCIVYSECRCWWLIIMHCVNLQWESKHEVQSKSEQPRSHVRSAMAEDRFFTEHQNLVLQSLKTAKILKLCDLQILDKNLEFPEKFSLVTSPNEEFLDHKVSGSWLFSNKLILLDSAIFFKSSRAHGLVPT